MPPRKAVAPITSTVRNGQGSDSCVAVVTMTARVKPRPIVRAFSRQGAGVSAMLAAIAPSVTGCPA